MFGRRRQPTVLALKPELVNSKLDGLRAAFRSMGLSETSARRVVMESQHVLILTVDTVAERWALVAISACIHDDKDVLLRREDVART